ncbi:MAG: AmmeMemoRadiSam system protein B [Methanomicrobium sp.]|nr:AmmeMemoRadiSam system protein B [Methanomicrobium sp.]
MVTRRTTLSGMFYPDNPVLLKRILDAFYDNPQLRDFFAKCSPKTKESGISSVSEPVSEGSMPEGVSAIPEDLTRIPKGIVSPHAGIVYSGLTSAYAYSAIPSGFSGTFVIIGPSHSGYSDCMSSQDWETPLGDIAADGVLIEELSKYLRVDDHAMGKRENSIEVQTLFVKHRFPNAKCVCVMMGNQTERNSLEIGRAIYNALSVTNTEAVIVASSDFSHYIPAAEAEKYDIYAIDALGNLDTGLFYRRIITEGISACGYGPIIAMTECCRLMGAEYSQLLKYSTSGDITGEYSEVVGYAAISVE